MSLPLKQSRAPRELAEILCNFLPVSGNKNSKGHVSFKSIADKVGVGDYWQPGSKQPMINSGLSPLLNFGEIDLNLSYWKSSELASHTDRMRL